MKLLAVVLLFLFAVTQGEVLHDEEAMLQAARATMDPKNVVTIGGRTYYINAISKVPVGLAATLCNDLGMVLVSFETLDEYHLVRDYVKQTIAETHYYYITSGNEYNDRWIWTGSGQIITDFEWESSSPDDPPQYDSSIVFNADLGWFDIYDVISHYFVCEQK